MSEPDKMRGMDLKTYKSTHGLTYEDLAMEIGVTQAKQARSYALGHIWPGTEQLEKIVKACEGVTIEDMHATRLRYRRSLRSAHRRVA